MGDATAATGIFTILCCYQDLVIQQLKVRGLYMLSSTVHQLELMFPVMLDKPCPQAQYASVQAKKSGRAE